MGRMAYRRRCGRDSRNRPKVRLVHAVQIGAARKAWGQILRRGAWAIEGLGADYTGRKLRRQLCNRARWRGGRMHFTLRCPRVSRHTTPLVGPSERIAIPGLEEPMILFGLFRRRGDITAPGPHIVAGVIPPRRDNISSPRGTRVSPGVLHPTQFSERPAPIASPQSGTTPNPLVSTAQTSRSVSQPPRSLDSSGAAAPTNAEGA